MAQKDGAIIHVERGYRIAEVLEQKAGDASRFVGYRVLGPGAEGAPVYATEDEARYALVQLLVRHTPGG